MTDTMDRKVEGVFWVKIPVSLIRGSTLSAEARALMCYCLSHAKGRWQIRPTVVSAEFGWSSRTRRRVFAECEQAGYLTGTVLYDKQKRAGNEWVAHEEPIPEGERTQIFKVPEDNVSQIETLKSVPLKLDQVGKLDQEEIHVGVHSENPPFRTHTDDFEDYVDEPTITPDATNPIEAEGQGNGKQSGRRRAAVPPQVEVVRKLTGRYPFKDLWSSIVKVLGDHPDIDLLTRCWKTWRMRAYNPMRTEWLFEWYPQGGPSDKFTKLTPEEVKQKNFWKNVP